MKKLYRFGIAVEKDLVDEFDYFARNSGYVNRSEAIRDLMRQFVLKNSLQKQEIDVVGSITMVFDHQTRELSKKLTEYQHKHHDEVISTMHIHLDDRRCLEILAVKGKSSNVTEISDNLLARRGVYFGELTVAAIDKKENYNKINKPNKEE